jgi:hypothetical protein
MRVSSGQISIEHNGERFDADFVVRGEMINVTYCCADAGVLRGSTKALGAYGDDPERLAELILTEIAADLIARRQKDEPSRPL